MLTSEVCLEKSCSSSKKIPVLPRLVFSYQTNKELKTSLENISFVDKQSAGGSAMSGVAGVVGAPIHQPQALMALCYRRKRNRHDFSPNDMNYFSL